MTRIVASDVLSLSHCPRRLWYEYNPPEGLADLPPDPFESLIEDMGLAHERAVLARLAGEYEVVEATSLQHTAKLMEQGTSAIYQAQLYDEADDFFGKPDFLLHHDDGQYIAADAKLARSVKKEIGVQVAFYRRLLKTDHSGLVFLGNGETAEVGPDFNPHLNEFVIGARTVLGDTDRPEVRYSASKCTPCPFNSICYPEFVEKEELTLLYGVDSRSVHHIEATGIETITNFSNADPDDLPEIPYLKGDQKTRAILQAKSWKTGAIIKRRDIKMPEGTWVHFDIETNPLTSDGEEHVYLWGFLKPPYGPTDFEYVWTDSQADDRAGWEAFLQLVAHYRDEWANLKLVHFSSYERGKIKAYAKRYAAEDHPTVVWLLDNKSSPLYDIQKAVTGNLVLPLPGYGLKALCKHADLVNFQWEDDEAGSQWSVVQYVKFLNETQPERKDALKSAILGYNRDDVTATQKLEVWLRSL